MGDKVTVYVKVLVLTEKTIEIQANHLGEAREMVECMDEVKAVLLTSYDKEGLEYDDELMHGSDKEGIDWFLNEILYKEKRVLHSAEIGDEIGEVSVIEDITNKD